MRLQGIHADEILAHDVLWRPARQNFHHPLVAYKDLGERLRADLLVDLDNAVDVLLPKTAQFPPHRRWFGATVLLFLVAFEETDCIGQLETQIDRTQQP